MLMASYGHCFEQVIQAIPAFDPSIPKQPSTVFQAAHLTAIPAGLHGRLKPMHGGCRGVMAYLQHI